VGGAKNLHMSTRKSSNNCPETQFIYRPAEGRDALKHKRYICPMSKIEMLITRGCSTAGQTV